MDARCRIEMLGPARAAAGSDQLPAMAKRTQSRHWPG